MYTFSQSKISTYEKIDGQFPSWSFTTAGYERG